MRTPKYIHKNTYNKTHISKNKYNTTYKTKNNNTKHKKTGYGQNQPAKTTEIVRELKKPQTYKQAK